MALYPLLLLRPNLPHIDDHGLCISKWCYLLLLVRLDLQRNLHDPLLQVGIVPILVSDPAKAPATLAPAVSSPDNTPAAFH
ncbi:hypothetical protein BHM03_00031998 [Ensete ventricosum]|nr:hypothetical protein BHM03_00031998 [Ensete ventricosum]